MDCPHCGKAFFDNWRLTDDICVYQDDEGATKMWRTQSTVCPSCHDCIIDLALLYRDARVTVRSVRAYPQSTFRKPTPAEVTGAIKEDYEEACKVLPISAKAAAALARRCLQAVLRDKGYPQRDLAVQIDALLNETDAAKATPSSLRETVDVIRNFGNFSAHQITDQTALQIIDVQDGEAEWCLDILEEMFDHYYVKPAQAAVRKMALNAKLAAAGKPQSK